MIIHVWNYNSHVSKYSLLNLSAIVFQSKNDALFLDWRDKWIISSKVLISFLIFFNFQLDEVIVDVLNGWAVTGESLYGPTSKMQKGLAWLRLVRCLELLITVVCRGKACSPSIQRLQICKQRCQLSHKSRVLVLAFQSLFSADNEFSYTED